MKLTKNSKLVMIGDSITDAGRAQPIGEGLGETLGRGYVSLVDALLGAAYPDLGIRVLNMGTGGHTVRDLEKRWQTDVLDLKPTWLSVMIGINDVWRQFDLPRQPETHVLPAEYERTLDALIGQTVPAVEGLVLMTPFYIESNKSDAMRARMDEYGAIIRRLSEKHGTLFADTQTAFDEVLTSYYPATLAWDRVHPGQVGHMVLARAFLKAIDFAW